MSWSTSLSGHARGATPDEQRVVEEGVREVMLDAFGKLKALEGHDFTPPTVYFQHLGRTDFGALLSHQTPEGSEE